MLLPRWYPTPRAVVAAGVSGLTERARREGVRVHAATFNRILGWAQNAPAPALDAELHRQLMLALGDDHAAKEQQVRAAEAEIVALLARTPTCGSWRRPASTSCSPANSPARPAR